MPHRRLAAGLRAAAAGARRSASDLVRRARRSLKAAVPTLVAAALLALAAAAVFIRSGIYDIAAERPHTPAVAWLLSTVRTNSVRRYARDLQAPPLRDPALVRRGLAVYRGNCQICHGAPGVRREQEGRGINPTPPVLMTAVFHWTDEEIYWIATRGLKMSGMPAFGTRLSEDESWAVVAFLREMAWLTPAEYRRWEAVDRGEEEPETVEWVGGGDDGGWAELARRGDADRGRALLGRHGCGTCHVIPRVGEGLVGPPLTRFAERHYLAGRIVNVPRSLVRWIVDPKGIDPGTVMPDVGATPAEALDMAAYLYTLGDDRRLRALRARARGPREEAAPEPR